MVTNLLLLHEFGIRAVINHILSEYRGCQDGVNILSADILKFAIQDEVIARGSDVYCRLLSEENKRENVAILRQQSD